MIRSFIRQLCPNHELKLLEKTLTKLRIKKRYKNFFRTIVTKFVVLATIVNKIIDKEDYLMLLLTSELHLNQRAKFNEDFYCELWADSPIKRSLNKSFWSWVMVTTLLIFYMDSINNVTYYSWNKLFKEDHLLLPWYDL